MFTYGWWDFTINMYESFKHTHCTSNICTLNIWILYQSLSYAGAKFCIHLHFSPQSISATLNLPLLSCPLEVDNLTSDLAKKPDGFQHVSSPLLFLKISKFPQVPKYSSPMFFNWPWFFVFISVLGSWPIHGLSPLSLASSASFQKQLPSLALLICQATKPGPPVPHTILLRKVCLPNFPLIPQTEYCFQSLALCWDCCLEDHHWSPKNRTQSLIAVLSAPATQIHLPLLTTPGSQNSLLP